MRKGLAAREDGDYRGGREARGTAARRQGAVGPGHDDLGCRGPGSGTVRVTRIGATNSTLPKADAEACANTLPTRQYCTLYWVANGILLLPAHCCINRRTQEGGRGAANHTGAPPEATTALRAAPCRMPDQSQRVVLLMMRCLYTHALEPGSRRPGRRRSVLERGAPRRCNSSPVRCRGRCRSLALSACLRLTLHQAHPLHTLISPRGAPPTPAASTPAPS